jgi:hypothetical protein
MGVRDGAGLQSVGKRTKSTVDGFEVLSQNVRMKSAGDQLGVYLGFFSLHYYVLDSGGQDALGVTIPILFDL